MAPVSRFGDAVLAERERWLLWLPVFLGVGVVTYFQLPAEPPWWWAPVAGMSLLALAGLRRVVRQRDTRSHLFFVAGGLAATAIVAGFTAAQVRTWLVSAPVLSREMGPVTVSAVVDRIETHPDSMRVTLTDLLLAGLPPEQTPRRMRIKLRGQQPALHLGDQIVARIVAMPPPVPAMPGAYDFAREAYFQRLGAVGYSAGSVSVARPSARSPATVDRWFAGLRHDIVQNVRRVVAEPAGSVIAALLVGERTGIAEPVMASIRDSGLAHLLAISGLHIGLVAAFLLLVTRSLLALFPRIALNYPTKKWAAVISLMGAGGYTLLANAPVPSQRAFLMLAVVLLAVLVDRRGISMRLVAFAGAFILLTQPETLLGPSFQMSFAAVVGLIAWYEIMIERRWGKTSEPSLPRRIALYFGMILVSSLIAVLATAPYAAYHFNRFTPYGLVANLVAIPLTGLWVMPLAVVSVLLMPFGLAEPALILMGWGVDVILGVAAMIAQWPLAAIRLPPMPGWSLGLITIGLLWLTLWRRRWRLLGGIPIALGVLGMVTTPTPDLLVEQSGKLVAFRGADDAWTFSSKVSGRAARRVWQRRLGEAEDGAVSAWPRQGSSLDGRLACDQLGCVYRHAGHAIAAPKSAAALDEDCRVADVVIAGFVVDGGCPSAGVVIDRRVLRQKGAHALWLGEGQLHITSVAEIRGDRPWVHRLPSGGRSNPPPLVASEENDNPGAPPPLLSTFATDRPAAPEP